MADDRIAAYDTFTGNKLPRLVPRAWLRIFPHLSETPRQKAKRQDTKERTDAEAAS